jgi:hypothetical protein
VLSNHECQPVQGLSGVAGPLSRSKQLDEGGNFLEPFKPRAYYYNWFCICLFKHFPITQALEVTAMPTLKNPRHERFAQLLASGKTATDAYELAGYKRNGGNGPAMARAVEISERVTEINENVANRAAITKADLVEMARDIYVQARKAGQNADAVAALKEIGVLTGIRIERRESGQPGEFADIEKMTAEELIAFLQQPLELPDDKQAVPGSSQTVN